MVHVSGDRLGDALLKYPTLRAFRAVCPNTRITWVTARRPSIFAGRLSILAEGVIDELHERSGVGERLLGALPPYLERGFDVVVCSESRLRDTLVLRRVPCGRLVAPALDFRFSSAGRIADYKHGSAYAQFAGLMSLAAGHALHPEPRLDLPPACLAAAAMALADGPRYVGFAPGAGGKRKIWPLTNFLELARRLGAHGFTPCFFLGPEEAALRETIARALAAPLFPEEAVAVRRLDTPLATAALARRMTFSVCNDSGGGHLIAAGGQPTVTLFGHTSARKFASPYCRQIAVCAHDFGTRDVAAIRVDDVMTRLQDDELL